MFSWATAIQASAAHSMLLGSILPRELGGEPDVTQHPDSGQRRGLDDMLNVIALEVKPKGEAADGFGGDDLLPLQDLANSPSLMTTADETGLTAEFPYGGYTGALKEIFGPRGKPQTAMLKIKVAPHPLLGKGCFVKLYLPVIVDDDASTLPNRMNRFETEEWVYLYGLGGWGTSALGGSLTLCHTTFLPAALQAPGLLCNFFTGSYARMLRVKNRFKLKAPKALKQNLELNDLIQLLAATAEKKGRP